ncbi:DUF6701 domain-containing protein [Zobellella maritima]|uniref:DUF6701 domain-containing protein n=1 Tax=Zobellella maritima TaxID=2059725 RepID=UPI0013001B7E|nr:DUF6701 domain-containing protein [Zobellella maritima]
MFSYNKEKESGKVKVDGQLYGYLYAEGKLEMNHGGQVYGAVNVIDLKMKKNTSINFRPYSSTTPLEPTINPGIGYVYGNATIRLSADSTSVTGATFIVSHDGSGTLTYRYGNNGIQALSGLVELPINQDIQVSYDKAAQIELSLKAADDNIAGGSYITDLTFVPKQLKWTNQSSDCGADLGFVYEQHQQSCRVLAKAGQVIPLTLQAYGEGNALLAEYSATIAGIEITELNANLAAVTGFNQAVVDFSQANEAQFYSSQAISQVALIEASVPSHCAPYAEQGDNCLLETAGDQALLGRTVPDALGVVGSVAGQVTGNQVYAGRALTFSARPVFTVQALDVNGQALPSYHGEFAGGLNIDNIGLALISDEMSLDGTAMPVTVQVNADGQHQIRVSDNEWAFPKGLTAFNARAIDEQLELAIEIGSDGVDNQPLTLPWSLDSREALVENAELRYGQLMISDLGLAAETEGTMPVYLQYFSQEGSLVEDNDFNFATQPVSLVAEPENDAGLPGLTQATDGIEVAAYAEAAEFQIRAEVETWLKTPGEAALLDPTATLTITAGETALRGHDRVIYRREAVR